MLVNPPTKQSEVHTSLQLPHTIIKQSVVCWIWFCKRFRCFMQFGAAGLHSNTLSIVSDKSMHVIFLIHQSLIAEGIF